VLLCGTDATPAALAQYAPLAGTLHLAGHLEHHGENALFSALQMSGNPLTPLDLRNLRLPGSLVYLSACSTGAGPVARSDDVLAFHRGFLAAGASSLVVTLWPVQDAAAREIAREFHRLFAAGTPPHIALAAAKARLRDGGAPFHQWAAYRFLGPAG